MSGKSYSETREVIKNYLKNGDPTREDALKWLETMITAIKVDLEEEDHVEQQASPTVELPVPEPDSPVSER